MDLQKTAFGLLLLASTTFAEAPRTMLFQGTISKSGTALTGNHKVVIDICESSDIDKDNCKRIYTNDKVAFLKGYYSVTLGEKGELPVFDKPYFLQVSVDGTTPESRIPLTSAPSALNAIRADSAKYAKLADSTAGGAKRADVAKTADFATKMSNIASSKDTTFFSDGVMVFDDTTTFGSSAGTAEALGVWSIKTLLSKDAANLTLDARRTTKTGTSGTTRNSTIELTNDEIGMSVTSTGYSGKNGGGSGSSLNMGPQNIEVSTSTLGLYASTIEMGSIMINNDTTTVNNVLRTTQPSVLIIPTDSDICENDPCSIDGQIILATSIVCGGGTNNYATNNKLMVCRAHFAGGNAPSLHWNHID